MIKTQGLLLVVRRRDDFGVVRRRRHPGDDVLVLLDGHRPLQEVLALVVLVAAGFQHHQLHAAVVQRSQNLKNN